MFIPVSMSFCSISTLFVFGPIVAMIEVYIVSPDTPMNERTYLSKKLLLGLEIVEPRVKARQPGELAAWRPRHRCHCVQIWGPC